MGGGNLADFVKRCLAPLISDELARKFSFLGRKEKDNFSKYAISKAVVGEFVDSLHISIIVC